MSQRHVRFGYGTFVVACAAAVFLSMATATPALAQDAVEWTEAEGGNGHWYAVVTGQQLNWQEAVSTAESQGGYLVTCTSQEENEFVRTQLIPCFGSIPAAWMGGFRESPEIWAWVTGEEWDYANWILGDPNDTSSQPALNFYESSSGCGWADQDSQFVYDAYVVEWSADCNGDGIVDYGQILDRSLSDGNGDGRPDVCDDYLHVPEQFATIAEAIDSASNGETILIKWGTYMPAQTLDTQGKAITIRGAGADSESPNTIIDGQDSIRVLICENGEGADTVFEHLLITGGLAEGKIPRQSRWRDVELRKQPDT